MKDAEALKTDVLETGYAQKGINKSVQTKSTKQVTKESILILILCLTWEIFKNI